MPGFLALLAVAALSWLFRISFTALIGEDRLPRGVRSRMDAVGPAAFAALLATDVSGTSVPALPPILVALAVAGVVAWRTRNHLVVVLAATVAWSLVALL